MEILGIGPMELAFIIIIALIILDPKDMVKVSKQAGTFLRRLVMSDTWKAIKKTSKEIENLPNKLMREAGVEDDIREMNNIGRSISASGSTFSFMPPAGSRASNSPQPDPDKPVLTSPPAPETPAQPVPPPTDLPN